MEKEPKIEKDLLSEIRLSDYGKIEGCNSEWIETQEIPDIIWTKVSKINSELTLRELFCNIRKELFDVYGEKRDKAKSFADSRFTSLPEMVERGMVSCGALVNIFGNILRKLGVSTKFIHGKLESQEGADYRHSWLEIYDPRCQTWIEVDPTKKDFEMASDTQRYKEYHNWQELKEDYDKGKY